ncbi:MAG TPA: hypothetical protein PKM25_15590 [Candidatus Ozemobacteraceae bacterium]|nr:hypothetical protein [Candidatus Ozemobacteraceae bacterium]
MHEYVRLARILSIGSLIFFSCPAAECATRVLKMKSQNPETVCATLQQLFGDRLRTAVVTSINAIVISADSEPALDEASALVAQLDRRPATFRFQVRRREHRSASESGFRIKSKSGSFPSYEQRNSHGSGMETRNITGMEGSWLQLTDDSTRIETLNTPWGPESAVVNHRQGIEIKGSLGASGTAVIEIRAASGPESRTSTILSRIEAPFGTWFSLGGTDRSGSEAHAESSFGRMTGSASGMRKASSLDDWEVLVDVIAAGE